LRNQKKGREAPFLAVVQVFRVQGEVMVNDQPTVLPPLGIFGKLVSSTRSDTRSPADTDVVPLEEHAVCELPLIAQLTAPIGDPFTIKV